MVGLPAESPEIVVDVGRAVPRLESMVVPIRLDPNDARRRFDAARAEIGSNSTLASMADTMVRLDESLRAAQSARAGLVETARQLDPESIDRELKLALRTLGPDAPEVLAIRRRRQIVLEIQDEIDDVDEHVHRTVVDIEALAAQSARSNRAVDTGDLGARMRLDLQMLRDDAVALDAARRELENL